MNDKNQNDSWIEQKSYDSDSSNNHQDLNDKKLIIKSRILIFLENKFNKFYNKIKKFFSKLSILCQFFFFIVPFSLFLFIVLLITHYHAFERVFKFDFYCSLKDGYLNHFTRDLDDIQFELGSSEIKSSYEELEELFFFKIYFKELISMGLFNESSKIYKNISPNSGSLYQSLDLFQKELKMSSYYTIPKKDSETYIDNRKDSFSEIAKLYYYLLPGISFEEYTRDIFINQSFLIAYEFDNYTKNINNDYLYFCFPCPYGKGDKSYNFISDNNLLYPKISKDKKVFHEEKKNNSYYEENWFIKQDYDFRILANEDFNARISCSHLNYNYYGKLNKTTIFSIQNYENINDKNYIINYIFFINQRDLKQQSFDYSTFLIINESSRMYILEKEKYSDNNTYLIFKSNIIELSLSSSLALYFHFGMYEKNNNFYKNAVSFDSFDIENLGEPFKYYNTTENFNIDLRYFSSLYLYTLLFLKSEYNASLNENTNLAQLNFEDKNNITKNLCKEYNYSAYQEYLENEKINCWNIQNMLYYSQKEIPKLKPLYNYKFMPYCICLPLYCLKDNNKNYNPYNIEYASNISLPERCQNYLKYFDNNYIKERETSKIIKINDKINLFSNNLKDKIESDFYIYKYIKFTQIPGIFLLIINYVDNSILKNFLSIILDSISIIQFHFIIGYTFYYFILIIVAINVLVRNIKKLSKVILNYQKDHEKYLYQSDLKINNKDGKKDEIGINEKHINSYLMNKLDNIFNCYDNSPLLKSDNENLDENLNNDNDMIYSNPLLDDLFKIFYNYYNISIEKLAKKYYKYKESSSFKNKIHLLEEKNELFKLLCILSLNAPKFKLNVSMDYNFYINSIINENLIKSIIKSRQTQQILLTQNVIYELLTSENIEDFGLISNLNFKYITNINLNSKKENSIKISIFKYSKKEIEYNKNELLIHKNKMILKEENNNSDIEIIWKERNLLMDELENNFENDDYIKRDKLESAFNYFLINVYYKYIKKIIPNEDISTTNQNNLE